MTQKITYPVHSIRQKVFQSGAKFDEFAGEILCNIPIDTDEEKVREVEDIIVKAANQVSQALR